MFEKKQVFSGEKCPACQEDQLDQNVVIYVEPKSKDELLIFTTICNNCKFKNSDIMPTGPSIFAGKKKFVVEVESQKDLDSKIFRSSSASIEIPELEIKLEPGIQAEFFITNIEGILFKFQESCKFLLKNEKKKEVIEILKNKLDKIQKFKNAEEKFTVILEDEQGFSYIVPFENR